MALKLLVWSLGMKMRIRLYLLRLLDNKQYFLYDCLGRESSLNNVMNVFNAGVTSSRVFFLTVPFNRWALL